MKRYRMWIGGEWVEAQGGAVRKLVNPATGEPLVDIPEAAPADVRRGGAARGSLSLLVREPLGVVAQIVPWSSPLFMAASKIAPALAAGCALIVKPARETPLSTLELARIAGRAGVPAGVLNVLTGDGG